MRAARAQRSTVGTRAKRTKPSPDGPRYEPGAVGVLDAEQEVSPVPAGEEGIVQGGPHTAHVERAGGTGGKADADAAGIHGLRRYVGESAGFVCKTSRF